MAKHTQPTMPAGPELVLPERVTIALGELAGAAREGLLSLGSMRNPTTQLHEPGDDQMATVARWPPEWVASR
jgi:hypothetical protein